MHTLKDTRKMMREFSEKIKLTEHIVTDAVYYVIPRSKYIEDQISKYWEHQKGDTMKKEVMVQKAEQLFDAVKQVKVGLGDAKHGMLLAGKYLVKINTEKLWRADGSPSKSFAHWVEMELSLSKSTCYNLMDAYTKVGELILNEANYKDLDMSKVFLLLPYIKDGASISDKEELLHMANSTTWRGLQDNIKNMKGKKASDECDHLETETFVRCKKCRSWLKD